MKLEIGKDVVIPISIPTTPTAGFRRPVLGGIMLFQVRNPQDMFTVDYVGF